ncbi:MAG: hypothetical protein ACFB15_25990 [Cyclobacteriaceae bacterium]
MNSIKVIPLFFLISLLALSCDSDDTVDNNLPENTANSLPLLKGDNKIGFITGFNPTNPLATTDSIDARWAEALSAGMSVGRLQIDWPELEPQPNVYDQDALKERLEEYRGQGLQAFLLISAYDSEGPVVPDDLQGLSFDDPTLTDRFNKLMDWVIPMLVEYDGYIISITNEADVNFGDSPNLANEVLTFLSTTKSHIHTIDKEMAVTVTLAEGSLDSNVSGLQEIINECNVTSWNFYGARSLSTSPYSAVQTEDEIKADIQRMIAFSGNKNIVIQVLGMHSGETYLGSSEEIQRQFFEVFFQEMQNNEQIKVAYVFQLVDWSPEVTSSYLQIVADEELPPGFINTIVESLETIGLIHYADGNAKPAWETFMKWLNEFE